MRPNEVHHRDRPPVHDAPSKIVYPANEYCGLVIVIPTRNRSGLAITAIHSILDQQAAPETKVLISDNSTDQEESQKLREFCLGLNNPSLTYIKTPQDMIMSMHWEWAMQLALDQYKENHFFFLTDRMIIKRGELGAILQLSKSFPYDVVSFNHDRIDDFSMPIFLEQARWTGKILRIRSIRLLRLSSQMVFHPCLPRMLNSVVPRFILLNLHQRAGSIFDSVSPDFCFCYRLLGTHDSILYYDKSLLIQYAIARSNGASVSRGLCSRDSNDFQNGVQHHFRVNFAVPLPQIISVGNAIINEFCAVKVELDDHWFPDLAMKSYLSYLAKEVLAYMNQDLMADNLTILKSHGWKKDARYWFNLTKKIVKKRFKFCPSFGTLGQAIQYANYHTLRKTHNTPHLAFLIQEKSEVSLQKRIIQFLFRLARN